MNVISGSLTSVLSMIAVQLHADPKELQEFAAEDNLGGYHWNAALATFPMGSCFGVEGQTLYALVRLLKPLKVVEIGGWAGCSGAHLAAAIHRNGFGEVISVDNEIGGMAHGSLLPAHLQQYVTLVRANGEDWLAQQPDQSIGLIFEDANHSTELVALLSGLAIRKLLPGGILANHDAAHDFAYVGGGQKIGSDVGLAVRAGLTAANIFFQHYLAEPSDCGLAISTAPGVWSQGWSAEVWADPLKGVASQVGIAPIEGEQFIAPAETIDSTTPKTTKRKPGRKKKGE